MGGVRTFVKVLPKFEEVWSQSCLSTHENSVNTYTECGPTSSTSR